MIILQAIRILLSQRPNQALSHLASFVFTDQKPKGAGCFVDIARQDVAQYLA